MAAPTFTQSVSNILAAILPKKKPNPAGLTYPSTYNPSATTSDLPIPGYREHLADVFTDRGGQDSRALLKTLFRSDPDVSAAVNAYLTVADVEPWYEVRDSQGNISRPGHQALQQVLLTLFSRFDYTKPAGFELRPTMSQLFEQMRYMILLRGGIGQELIINKFAQAERLRHVDLATFRWQETAPGQFLPVQIPLKGGGGGRVILDTPLLFVSFYRQDPTDIYSFSPFISAINTIASRQQIINDLYRIMQMTGYPKMDITLIEEIVKKNAPADVQTDATKMRDFVQTRLGEITRLVSNLKPDQALVHYDSVEVGMMNDKMPGMSLNVDSVITVLNAQNQAALKVMATVIGRGDSGTNTASVESRMFALNAEQINRPIADIMSQALTLAIRLQGIDAIVTVGFEHIEMRPHLELEANKLIQQTRWLQLLSLGVVDDDTFHLELFNRVRPDSSPELSGTGFMNQVAVDTTAGGAQPNATDKVAGGAAASRQAKSKAVKPPAPK